MELLMERQNEARKRHGFLIKLEIGSDIDWTAMVDRYKIGDFSTSRCRNRSR